MKRQMLTLAFMSCLLQLSAQDSLKIIYLEPSPVEIGGKLYKKGDSFLSSDKPRWTSDRQFMKVFDKASGKVKVITAALMKASDNKSILTYLTETKQLSTRGGKLLNFVELSAFFNRAIGLLERISVDAWLPVDSSRFYFVGYEYDGENINKKLPVSNNLIVIDRSIFIIDGVKKEPFDTQLKLYYYDAATEQSRLIADRLELKIISAKACRTFIENYLNIGLSNDDIKELTIEYLSVYQPNIFFQSEDIELFVTDLILNIEKK
ncbi:MAG: hypothetical protein LBH19_09275 [Dysgonamonadaceae bacterium]|jgi:hypothetical protein|nr:hypothetical protein [Dysgonamonadaceae bacterium]